MEILFRGIAKKTGKPVIGYHLKMLNEHGEMVDKIYKNCGYDKEEWGFMEIEPGSLEVFVEGKALKEIQNYRKLGTLEELARAKKYIDLAKKHGTIGEMIDECAAYEEIGTIEQVRNQKDNLNTAYKIISDYESCGTVEECRKATEKQKPKKCIEDSRPDHTHYKCPSCGKIQKTKYDNSTFGCILNNCSNCGQALEMEVEDD